MKVVGCGDVTTALMLACLELVDRSQRYICHASRIWAGLLPNGELPRRFFDSGNGCFSVRCRLGVTLVKTLCESVVTTV